MPTCSPAGIASASFFRKPEIDKSRKTSISKDLDYLYKHCLFSVIRVRDNEDFAFLDGCVNVLSDITEGWERVDLSIKKAPAFG